MIRKQYIMFAIFLSLALIGFSYSMWTQKINIDLSLSTGRLDILFGNTSGISAEVADESGNGNGKMTAKHITKDLSSDKKNISIDIIDPFMSEFLICDEKRFIKIAFPLEKSSYNTITAINTPELNLSKDTYEIFFAEPLTIKLMIGDEEFDDFFSDGILEYNNDLAFNVYRQYIDNKNEFSCCLYIAVSDNSVYELKDVSTDIYYDEADLPDEFISYLRYTPDSAVNDGDILLNAYFKVTYNLDIPIRCAYRYWTDNLFTNTSFSICYPVGIHVTLNTNITEGEIADESITGVNP